MHGQDGALVLRESLKDEDACRISIELPVEDCTFGDVQTVLLAHEVQLLHALRKHDDVEFLLSALEVINEKTWLKVVKR